MFGICIVTFGSEDVIGSCLESLRVSEDQNFRVAIYDNASTDGTCDAVVRFASAAGWSFEDRRLPKNEPAPDRKITLLRSKANRGYAGGVNGCLEFLMSDPEITCFWVLNPDSEASPTALGEYRKAVNEIGPFGLMGGRTLYLDEPGAIQSDGGRVSLRTGICRSVNQGQLPQQVEPPAATDVDFISGANVVASRQFVETVGLMKEDYFLFYEEVDWAMRRGSLPLHICPEAVVYHHGGTAIGSGSVKRRATGFANYFNYRNRMRFIWRFRPYALPTAYAYSAAKVLQLVLLGAWREAVGAFRGMHQLSPPREVYQRIDWPPPP